MCRLLGYVSLDTSTFQEIVGPDLQEFVTLSKIHCDGWGIATANAEDLRKAPEAALESKDFTTALQSTHSNGALLHLRWATAGLPVSKNNSHPFSYKNHSFIHNGSIKPIDGFAQLISEELQREIKGDTDSERYFFLLIEKIESLGLEAGIKEVVTQIKNHFTFSSINAMLLTPDSYVVINEHDSNARPEFGGPDYYDLFYKKKDGSIAVGSSGWNQSGWTFIENHTVLIVNRADLSLSTFPITSRGSVFNAN